MWVPSALIVGVFELGRGFVIVLKVVEDFGM